MNAVHLIEATIAGPTDLVGLIEQPSTAMSAECAKKTAMPIARQVVVCWDFGLTAQCIQ